MPLWQIFVPENDFSLADKRELGNRITDIYTGNFELPRFYTTVVFHDLKPGSFLVGGEEREKFVQIAIVHAARTAGQIAERFGGTEAEVYATFMQLAHAALKPFVADRGYEWEMHTENVPHETWHIDGMEPPPPWSDAEKVWAKNNRSSPYEMAAL